MSEWNNEKSRGKTLQTLGIFVFMIIIIVGMINTTNSYGFSGSNRAATMLITYIIIAIVVSTPIIFFGDRKIRIANKKRMSAQYQYYQGGRPTGVIILAIINFVIGIGIIVDGFNRADSIVSTPFLGNFLRNIPFFNDLLNGYLIINSLMGIFYLVMGGSLFIGKDWARSLVRFLAIMGGLASLLSILFGNLLGILYLIWYWIVYAYLGQSHVEEFFFFHSQSKPRNNYSSKDDSSKKDPSKYDPSEYGIG
jgi:hypothetical protein